MNGLALIKVFEDSSPDEFKQYVIARLRGQAPPPVNSLHDEKVWAVLLMAANYWLEHQKNELVIRLTDAIKEAVKQFFASQETEDDEAATAACELLASLPIPVVMAQWEGLMAQWLQQSSSFSIAKRMALHTWLMAWKKLPVNEAEFELERATQTWQVDNNQTPFIRYRFYRAFERYVWLVIRNKTDPTEKQNRYLKTVLTRVFEQSDARVCKAVLRELYLADAALDGRSYKVLTDFFTSFVSDVEDTKNLFFQQLKIFVRNWWPTFQSDSWSRIMTPESPFRQLTKEAA